MKNFKGVLVVGEKAIFSELAEIVDVASKANKIIKLMFKLGYEEKTLVENMNAVQTLEKKSDEIAFRLSEDITSGAISPNAIDILIECSHKADDIIDLQYYLSRELCRMTKAKPNEFSIHQENEWSTTFENMLNLADQALMKLKLALASSNVQQILELRKQIEQLEEQGDEIKDSAFDKLYGIAPKLHYLQFYHNSELLHKCDDILDSCEDLSDLIVSAVTSILK